MPVSGGGAEVAVFNISFFLPFEDKNFLLAHLSKLVIFIESERDRAPTNFIHTEASSQKT